MDMDGRSDHQPLLLPHGGYRTLKSFQVAQLVYDVTVRFCERFIDKRSRTYDQMVQAARSGVQNIAEGSLASATSKATEITLTNVARASLGELQLDYEDFLRQRDLPLWEPDNPLRAELVTRRPANIHEMADWVKDVRERDSLKSDQHIDTIRLISSSIVANSALVLIGVAISLLARQVNAQMKSFEEEGGFKERLYRIRQQHRGQEN